MDNLGIDIDIDRYVDRWIRGWLDRQVHRQQDIKKGRQIDELYEYKENDVNRQ